MKRFLVCLLLCGGSMLRAAPASGAALTLDDVLRAARAANPEWRAQRAELAAAEGRAVQAGRWENPRLTLSVEEAPAGSDGLSEGTTWFGIEQEFPLSGRKGLERGIGQAAWREAEAQLRLTDRDWVRRLKAAYVRVAAARASAAASDELVELAASLVAMAGKRVAAGSATEQELLRVELAHERTLVARRDERRNLAEAEQVLARLMGRPGEPLPLLAAVRIERPPLVDREVALRDHPRLQLATARLEREEWDARLAARQVWPDVAAGIAAGRNGAENEDVMEVHLSAPLPLFDRARGRRREAQARVEAARLAREAVEQELRQDLAQGEARVTDAAAQVDVYRDRILPRAEQALTLVQRGFDAGQFHFFDLLDVQRTVAEVRLGYGQRRLNFHLAVAELEALLPEDGNLELNQGVNHE